MNEIVNDLKRIDALLNEVISKLAANNEVPSSKNTIEFVDVRKALVELSRNGKTSEVKNLLTKFGANKLSEVDPSNYEDLLKQASKLNG